MCSKADEKFRDLLTENPQVAVQGFTRDGGIHYWNRASEDLYGYSREEIGSIHYFDLLQAEHAERVRDQLDLLDSNRTASTVELAYRHRDGSSIPVLSSFTRIASGSGDGGVEYYSFDLDLRNLKRLEAQLLRAQRLEAIGSLAGGIAHDLNNILAPIMMSVDLLESGFPEEHPQRHVFTIMRDSLARAGDLTRQVLSFGRGLDSDLTAVDLGALLGQLQKLLSNTLPRNITLQVHLPDALPRIRGDFTQLHQVLLNLAINARDAMPDGGSLALRASTEVVTDPPDGAVGSRPRPGSFVRLVVADTGTGMSPETLMRSFEPFFTTKPSDQGTGLGLSTSLSILKSHRGFITVDSALGSGTSFAIYLPVPESAPDREAADPLRPAARRGNGEKILVVDDETTIREVTRDILTAFGYRVLAAENGSKAVDLFREHPDIRLVVTDLMMPVMDGAAAMRVFRRERPEVPILATSGLSSTLDLSKQSQESADLFLHKPYDAPTLLQAIQRLLPPE